MRSRLFICAALAGSCLFGTWSPAAHAADPKGKAKKGSTSDSDDKVINKQLQWEESVMGPDDKQAELAKIARAQAINKAAAEKAAKEKEKADAQAAREKEKADAAPKAQTSKRGGEVALPTLPDEDSGKGKSGKTSEISPKLETAAAAAPPPPVKHGDDRFIDKLLTDSGGNKKHKASTADDKALDDLLATDKSASGGGKTKGKKDDVDALLSAKPQPVVETHIKHETPEWAKPEISSTPVESPLPVRQAPKRDDGIIHVTQGAASVGHPVPAAHHTVTPPPPPARSSTVASRSPATRRQAAPAPSGSWDDPFADRSGPKKAVAARESHGNSSGADDLDGLSAVNHRRPASRGAASRDGSDEGSESSAKATGGTRRATPAAKPKWKDPFTESESPAPARSTVASRETRAHNSGESAKWDVAERHASAAEPADSETTRSGRWGVLKKHAH